MTHCNRTGLVRNLDSRKWEGTPKKETVAELEAVRVM
jgi:hypothetical protein